MKKIIVLALLFGCGQVCSASDRAVLQDKLNAIKTMRATFKQVIKAKKKEISRSSGSMALSRPGRFRWDTKNPMPQLVVADGKKLWVYDVDLEQVTVKKQEKGVGGTAGLFLSGYNDTVARDFLVTRTTKGKQAVFDLKAKSAKENFQRVKLFFAGKTLKAMVLFDQLGQQTDVELSNIQINPNLPAKLFQFKPPKGVDVVEQ